MNKLTLPTVVFTLFSLMNVASAERLALKLAEPATARENDTSYSYNHLVLYLDPSHLNWVALNNSATLGESLQGYSAEGDFLKMFLYNKDTFLGDVIELDHTAGPQAVIFGEAATAPDVQRSDLLIDEAGAFNHVIVDPDAYFIDITGRGFGGLGEIRLLVDIDGQQGDFNYDGSLNAADLNLYTSLSENQDWRMDLNGDRKITLDDRSLYITNFLDTVVGDANLDRVFNSDDLLLSMQAGKYETGVAAAWEEGDFDGDGRFATTDMILALQGGNYDVGVPAVPVPEPSSFGVFLCLIMMSRRLLSTGR